jgi:tripartite motif-containing protein 71
LVLVLFEDLVTNIGVAVMYPVEQYSFVTKWGSLGSSDGQFVKPQGIAVDLSSGNVYVADTDNNRIQKFTSNGTFITKWGSYGPGNYQFTAPTGIAVEPSSSYVYVADAFNNRIQVFDRIQVFALPVTK